MKTGNMIITREETRNDWIRTELLEIARNALEDYQQTGKEVQYDIYLKLRNFIDAEFL